MVLAAATFFAAIPTAAKVLFSTVPFAMSNSMGLSSAPAVAQLLNSGLSLTSGFAIHDASYELLSFLDTTQGLAPMKASLCGLLNPGADLDFSTTTDFEDLAAPVADIVEFTDQDRALAADYVSSAVLWKGLLGGGLGVGLHLILSPNF